jgi:nucleotidyltransferase substrate binding protein (TIGR01987 family)
MSGLEQKLSYLEQALERLNKTLYSADQQHHDVYRDATIQRFEFTFELTWKSLKAYLRDEGFDVRSPREVLKKAFTMALLGTEEDLWLTMLNDRNSTTHLYDQTLAEAVFRRILNYAPAIAHALQCLRERVQAS